MISLESPQSYRDATPEERAAQSNGIGPEKWPKIARELVTLILHDFKESAKIHDWEFGPAENNGERWKWHQTNERFGRNCKAEGLSGISWWRFLARRAMVKMAKLMQIAVESDSGWEAYRAAWQRNQKAPTPGE